MFVVKRSIHNPIIVPTKEDLWRSIASFNWCPIKYHGVTHVLYRAAGTPEIVGNGPRDLSTIGYAKSRDGIFFDEHKQLIKPEFDWEKYGCEDPRVGRIDDMNYIFYTALSVYPFRSEGIKVAVALTKDFKTIEEKHLVTPFNAKAMVIFPEKINGKIVAILSAHTDSPPARIAMAKFDKPEEMWDPKFWEEWHDDIDHHSLDLRRSPSDHIEVGAPPIKTPRGWLLLYSHIQNYFGGGKRVFGVEALLLDLYYPDVIIGRTKGPILVPEEIYEKFGQVPDVVFPTGALVEDNTLKIYYGASDTTCAIAEVNLDDLVESLLPEISAKYVKRFEKNPILLPIPSHAWESKAVFNPATIDLKGKIHILYRAMSDDNTSTVGYATSKDGLNIDERYPDPIYVPREPFENKGVPGGNSGCEDPRIVLIKDRIYMTYTAYDGIHAPTVAITSISKKDFLDRKFGKWDKPIVITPAEVDDKDSCLLPEKIDGKYLFFHRIGNTICADYFKTLDFHHERVSKCIEVMKPREGMWDGKKVGIAAPPIKTKKGWLLFYHGVSESSNYRVGACLLDLKDPTSMIARTTDAILMPEMRYEIEGQVPNVVFPCGVVIRKNDVFIHYGGGDSVVAVATMKLNDILKVLK